MPSPSGSVSCTVAVRATGSPSTGHWAWAPGLHGTSRRWPSGGNVGCGESGHSKKEAAMKALVYGGPRQKSWTEVPDPAISDPRDAIIQVDTVTICGTDLHILGGDVPAVT